MGKRLMAQGKSLKDIVDWGLCTGCGACAAYCPRGVVHMVDFVEVGLRPAFGNIGCEGCTACLALCPGLEVDCRASHPDWEPASEQEKELGPYLEIWEGQAADPEIQNSAASGGVVTALALHCLEREGMEFVSHTAMSPSIPLKSQTVRSRSRQELLERAGARYAPSSPCDGLKSIEESPRPCVFIGRPCDATAVQKYRKLSPTLDRNLGLTLSLFCSGVPSTRGALDLLQRMGCDARLAGGICCQGAGSPEELALRLCGPGESSPLSSVDAPGDLPQHRSCRCHLCPDGLGRNADIACGDAWNRFGKDGQPGMSLLIVRTERGRELLRRAHEAGALRLKPIQPEAAISAQQGLLARRTHIFGRLLAFRLLGIPRPHYTGYALREDWVRLSLGARIQSVAGAIKRILRERLWRRRPPGAVWR